MEVKSRPCNFHPLILVLPLEVTQNKFVLNTGQVLTVVLTIEVQ